MLAIWSDVDFLSAIREVKVDHETLLPMAKKWLWRQHELGVYCSQLTSANGTNLPIHDVCSTVAIRGKADIICSF